MGAYKQDVVIAITIGAYIHGCLFCVSTYYPDLWYLHLFLAVQDVARFLAPRGGEKKAPGVHCSHMHQVSMVTCILFRYTKITTNFSLPAGRPHCRAMLLARNIWKNLKSEIISL